MTESRKTATAYVGIGANLGDRTATMRAAVHAIHNRAGIVVDFTGGVASLYESNPVGGGPPVPDFYNSCVRLHTIRLPHDLLDALLAVERTLGRTRAKRSAARPIDLDLLLYEDLVLKDDRLTLPHPHLHERRFVLEPLAEIAGRVLHPRLGMSVDALARRRREDAVGQTVTRKAGPDWCRLPTPATASRGTA